MKQHLKFIQRAIDLAKHAMEANHGGPFGAVVVKNGKIVGEGYNQVLSTNDPTAHAEIIAIRDACKNLNNHQLDGCIIYSSCEPCPMCLGAIYWARPKSVYFASTREEAVVVGFDDHFIHEEFMKEKEIRKIKLSRINHKDAWTLFRQWEQKMDKTAY